MSDQIDTALAEAMNSANELFNQLCNNRLNEGAEEYGEFAFLGNDVIRMMAEELVDMANYARMQFIKILLLEQDLAAMLEEQYPEKLSMGKEAFKGAKDGWKK